MLAGRAQSMVLHPRYNLMNGHDQMANEMIEHRGYSLTLYPPDDRGEWQVTVRESEGLPALIVSGRGTSREGALDRTLRAIDAALLEFETA